MVPITVNTEAFNEGPATELRKLNLFDDGIKELQNAVRDIQNTPAPTTPVTFVQMMVFVNGELKKDNIATDGNQPIDP